jgi:hypothetical protein
VKTACPEWVLVVKSRYLNRPGGPHLVLPLFLSGCSISTTPCGFRCGLEIS